MPSTRISAFLMAAAIGACLPQTALHAQTSAQAPANFAQESYRKARQILDAGVAAIGGADALARVDTVSREFEASRMDPGQARSAWNGEYEVARLPAYSRGVMGSIVDYAGNRMRSFQTDEGVAGDDNIFVEVSSPDQNFSLNWIRAEKPFYSSLSSGAGRARHGRELRLHPEALLKAALRQAATLGWNGRSTLNGAAVDIISFADPQLGRLFLYFDASTHLLVRSESISEHSVLGDSTLSMDFSDYRPASLISVPHRVVTRRNDVAARDYRLTSIAINTALRPEDFAPPQSFVAAAEGLEAPRLEPRGKDVYEIRGAYNVMFAVFGDYVLLVEAPRDENYTREIFGLIRSVAPGKPIKVVATHLHTDHIGGMRYAASQADEIWAGSDAKAAIEQALASASTIRPDEYSRKPKPAMIKLIGKRHVFEDSKQRVEIADVGPLDHAAQLLVAYFPTAETILVADIWEVPAHDQPVTRADSERLMTHVKRLDWKVAQLLPVHGVPASMASLERSLSERGKYLAEYGGKKLAASGR